MLVMLNVQTNGIRVIQGSMKDLRLSNNFKHSYRMSAYYQCFLKFTYLRAYFFKSLLFKKILPSTKAQSRQ